MLFSEARAKMQSHKEEADEIRAGQNEVERRVNTARAEAPEVRTRCEAEVTMAKAAKLTAHDSSKQPMKLTFKTHRTGLYGICPIEMLVPDISELENGAGNEERNGGRPDGVPNGQE